MEYPEFVDKKKIDILLDEESDLRYYIKVPLQYKEAVSPRSVLVILKNPSKAKVNHKDGLYESDSTLNRVISYFFEKKYTEVVMVNLFARYFTHSDKLNDYVDDPDAIIGQKNDVYIKGFVESGEFERIIVAWGGYPKNSNEKMRKLYKKRIGEMEKLINKKDTYYVEKMVEERFPKHGMVWSLKAPMKKYESQFI